jgi:prolyl-tRNA synthetase
VWPRELSPADVHIVATGKDEDVFTTADEVTAELERRGVSVLYDDRRKVSPGVKFKDAELIGVPTIVVLGRNLADGTVEVRDRRTGDKRDVVVAQAVDQIVAEVLGASTP